MFHPHLALALLCFGTGATHEAPDPAAAVVIGHIGFNEYRWGIGSRPTLDFTVSPGRGTPDKVAAFLYFSEEPSAFSTTTFPPMFVGIFEGPGTQTVYVPPWPERGPINVHSREKYVQGALFDLATGLLSDVTNEDYLDIAYPAEPAKFKLDFETEDDFTTPLVNGQDLSTPDEFGLLVNISALQPSVGPQHQGPAIFDSDPAGPNAGSSDPDLLVDRGNVCILQENPGQTTPGIFDLPDDSANGGSIVFEFAAFDEIEKAEPVAIDLIDIDAGSGTGVKVLMTDILGRTRTYSVPSGWTEDIDVNGPPGYRTLDLRTLLPQPGFAATAVALGAPNFLTDEVVRIEILLGNSGAVDNLVFNREAETPSLARRASLQGGSAGPRPR